MLISEKGHYSFFLLNWKMKYFSFALFIDSICPCVLTRHFISVLSPVMKFLLTKSFLYEMKGYRSGFILLFECTSIPFECQFYYRINSFMPSRTQWMYITNVTGFIDFLDVFLFNNEEEKKSNPFFRWTELLKFIFCFIFCTVNLDNIDININMFWRYLVFVILWR